MNAKFFLLLSVLALACASCAGEKDAANANSGKTEVVIDDGYKRNEKNEVVIEDQDLKYIQEVVATAGKSTVEKPIMAKDGSSITVMTDGYGNKSIQRVFSGHERVGMVLMRVSTRGQKQIFVYAQNGEVKELPAEMEERILSGTGDEIANTARIYEGRRKPEAEMPKYTSVPPQQQPSFPTPAPQIVQPPVETKPDDTTPAAETETRSDQTTKESAQKQRPQNLSEDLQNYIPRRRNVRDSLED